MQGAWHTQEIPDVLQALHTDERGLNASEAAKRLKEIGLNVLPEAKSESYAIIFARQFKSPLIYVLLAAAGTVFVLGEVAEGIIILAVLIFNAVVGSIQEGRAQNTLRALNHFIETSATVLRGGQEIIISDKEVVEGDIIILQEGEKVPADARVVLAHSLRINESSLTGESVPVTKMSEALEKRELPPAEQKNMVFRGSLVVAGNGHAIATATGERTEIGRIASEITTYETEIPLAANIRNLSHLIIGAVFVICVFVFTFGLAVGFSASDMFLTAVAIAVSSVPEGLPLVLTLVLATGVWRMGKRHALVKRLQAVEALGQARVIAVDKTGTLTKNEIVVERAYIEGNHYSISGVGYETVGRVMKDGVVIEPGEDRGLLRAARIAALSSNAHAVYLEEKKEWRVTGDPTEAAMLVFARKLGASKEDLERALPLIAELPFDSAAKYHALLHREGGEGDAPHGLFLSVTGAPEVILARCRFMRGAEGPESLTDEAVRSLEEVFLALSREGLRVVALAERAHAEDSLTHEDIDDLTFVGFLGMKDGLRAEVPEALARAHVADIRVVMITGDHKVTAEAIAKEAGIFRAGDKILTGEEMDTLSDNQLAEALGNVTVFARMTPEHKLRIVRAYRARGEIIAMTGDGVNDAPSLVAADLGVAMGGIGTEVAKEASDIVLLDDNFGSIVSAIEEGRSIYKTIKKVLLYLFSTDVGELITIIGALMLLLPLPLLPAQIIWLNLVTDGFLTGALAMEPKEKGLLRGTFEHPSKYLIDISLVRRMLLLSITMAIGTLALFIVYLDDLPKALTVSLTTLAIFQWFRAWTCRSETESVFRMDFLSNPYLIGATAIVIVLQTLAVYAPPLQAVLHTAPLLLADWALIIVVCTSIVFVDEIRKVFIRRAVV